MTATKSRPPVERPACVIDGCKKPAKKRSRYCSMHRARIERHGDPFTVKQEKRATREPCLVPGCANLDHGPQGYCHMHETRLRRHGDVTTVWPNHSGVPTYNAVHLRLARHRGPAAECPCEAAGCARQAAEWALVVFDGPSIRHEAQMDSRRGDVRNVPYSLSPTDYRPLCHGCHVRLDVHGVDVFEGVAA